MRAIPGAQEIAPAFSACPPSLARRKLLLHFLHVRHPWRPKKTPHFCGVLLRS
jgi:hypothetical protein